MKQHKRPVIGINADLTPATKTAGPYLRLAAGYFDAVLTAGGVPVVIPPLNKEPELDAVLDLVQGVVLCGGLDLDPRRSGQPGHPALVPMTQRREESDRLLVKRIAARKLPVLGVGVGMQQLNVAGGGTLFLHLPEEQPKALPHFDPSGGPHRHMVTITPKTRLDDIYGGGEIRVNSLHHQAVKTVAPRMRVAALAHDGVIEAVESLDPDWFCIGVQWHPEAESAAALDLQLFDCFVQACHKGSRVLAMAA